MIHANATQILKARNYLSVNLRRESPLFRDYLVYLLESIVNKGDVVGEEAKNHTDIELAAREIAPLLQPLALLVSTHASQDELFEYQDEDVDVPDLFRDAWYNIAAHGFNFRTPLGQRYSEELRLLAKYSRPLVAEDRAEQFESDVELNTILRRGMTPHATADLKKDLIAALPNCESDVRRLSYPKVLFLSAVHLVETLRASAGDCSKVLTYFLEPSLKTSEMSSCMQAIVTEVVSIYLNKALSGQSAAFSGPLIAKQLVSILVACCHRIERVQIAAALTADRIIAQAPSALCQKSSLFALLELLSIMWTSCLEFETDEYEWHSSLTSTKGKFTLELSDSIGFRKHTLNSFHKRAKTWTAGVMSLAPLDIKGLLQTYLSEFDDAGAYGHVSLGRSFALELGALIPSSDQRLGAIDRHGDLNLNVASDFIAQYTTRQEYRYAEAVSHYGHDWLAFMNLKDGMDVNGHKPPQILENSETVIAKLEQRIRTGSDVSIDEMRDVLRRSASLLCRSKKSLSTIVHSLVAVPFETFTKQAIKLGISLWLGVIHENPRMEPRILTEVAQAWENTITLRMGLFSESFTHVDPFYLKEEFAPSDKETLLALQREAQDIISPHLRVLQFFESHYNATRLGSPHTQKTFLRLITATLIGLKHSTGHPLVREFHFHVVLFGLKVLRYSNLRNGVTAWKFKDEILTAALSWFGHPPRWSFGGNRLQIKAEVRILTDVLAALQNVSSMGTSKSAARKTLQPKQELLTLLIENEISRLRVWLFPLEYERRSYSPPSENVLSSYLRLAWAESPGLAIQMAARFSSEKVKRDVRWLLLNFPEKALDEADALPILLGPELPSDVSFQLKYLLYWTAVDPITAVTYFLPAYGNHPFMLQYAMRALESHDVDVTFFYVPQVVQTLRYDALGYVERFILEAGKISQLFAHQIIWNMKANAYKDEDSTIVSYIVSTRRTQLTNSTGRPCQADSRQSHGQPHW